jgi:hypothetical protein
MGLAGGEVAAVQGTTAKMLQRRFSIAPMMDGAG